LALELHKQNGDVCGEAVKKLSDAFAKNDGIRDKNTGSILRGNDALNQEYKNIEAQASLYGKFKAIASDALKVVWQHIVDTFSGKTVIDSLEWWINNMPGYFKTGLDAAGKFLDTFTEGFKNAFKRAIDWIIDRLNDLKAKLREIANINIPVISGLAGGIGGLIPGQAEGGTTTSPGLSWVGEEGPELLSLPRGATVAPLDKISVGSSEPKVINLYLSDGTMIARWVMDEIEGMARLRGAS
jgi:phage-related tail protein